MNLALVEPARDDESSRFTLGEHASDQSLSAPECRPVIRTTGSDPQRTTFGSPGWRLSFSGSSAEDPAQVQNVLLPSFDAKGRLSSWLSDPEGSATRLSVCIYAGMIGYAFVWLFFGTKGLQSGIISLLGCRQLSVSHHHIGQCHTESMAAAVDVAIHLAKFAFFLVAGPAAFHSLRCVHRPQAAGGELALLRASCGHSTESAKRRLELWGWIIRALGAVSTIGLLVGAVVASIHKERFWVALMCIGVAAAVAATTGWWLSMMVGAALVQTPVDRVRAQVQAARLPLDVEEWQQIEKSALQLASTSLPLLSSGWGASLGLVGLSYTSLITAAVIAAFHNGGRSLVTNALTVGGGSRWVVAMFLFVFGPFPLLMARPAAPSRAAQRWLYCTALPAQPQVDRRS
jgi:hypothetical protein